MDVSQSEQQEIETFPQMLCLCMSSLNHPGGIKFTNRVEITGWDTAAMNCEACFLDLLYFSALTVVIFSHPCGPPASPNSDFFLGVRNQAQRQEGALEVIAQTSLHQPVAASRRSSSPSVRGECGPQVPSFIPSLGSDLFANW